jgi:hypothetical protein
LPDTFDALDLQTSQELEILYRDGMLGGRAGLFFASHIMALLHAISGAFAKHHRALKPADFFPHLEE